MKESTLLRIASVCFLLMSISLFIVTTISFLLEKFHLVSIYIAVIGYSVCVTPANLVGDYIFSNNFNSSSCKLPILKKRAFPS